MALYLGPNLISGVFTSYHTTTYDTSDANATSADILMGKKAYVNGSLVTGNIPSRTGNDVTTSGATFTIPAGHYASAYTGNISNGALRTPSYSTNASTGTVTVTYGVSTAGYLATSSPTWTFTPFTTGAVKVPTASANTSTGVVTITYGVSTAGLVTTSTSTTTVTPFTVRTNSGNVSLAAGASYSYSSGYYPNSHGCTAAAGGGGVTLGTFSITSAVDTDSVSLSTDGYPDGLCFTPVDYLWGFGGDDTYPEIIAGQMNAGFITGDAIPCVYTEWRYRSSGDYETYYVESTTDNDFCEATYSSYTLTISTPGYYFAEGDYKYAIWY